MCWRCRASRGGRSEGGLDHKPLRKDLGGLVPSGGVAVTHDLTRLSAPDAASDVHLESGQTLAGRYQITAQSRCTFITVSCRIVAESFAPAAT
jgi:hypothetical protein